MGLFDRLFGGNRIKVPDGKWLEMVRSEEWIKIDVKKPGGVFELSKYNCFVKGSETYFIFRHLNSDRNAYTYVAAVSEHNNHDIHILVDRIESTSGNVIEKDNFSPHRGIDESKGIAQVAITAKNLARLYGFNSEPAYLMWVMLGYSSRK